MRAFATRARTARLLIALALAATAPAAAAPAPGKPAAAKPFERRLHSDKVEASSFLWNDSNKFVENYHPNYVADDDPSTAWIEGAKSSGAGEWLQLGVGLEMATRVRLRVRNGYQRSKDLWKANARAKEVTVHLLPDNLTKQVTLTDTDGWQEIVIVLDHPLGVLWGVKLSIGSVYAGTRSTDLAISDVQVFGTSEKPDHPEFEKSRLANLTSWKNARLDAAKSAAKQAELPTYPAYEVRQVREHTQEWPSFDDGVLDLAMKDPGFVKEWKDALTAARAVEKNLGSMTRAQLAPMSQTRLVEVHGLQIAGVYDAQSGAGTYPRNDAIRLPMLGLVSVMFADQLRAADVKTGPTIEQYKQAPKGCGTDVAWVARTQPKEGPGRVAAIALGRCLGLVGRGAPHIETAVEILIYDATGKLVLMLGEGHLEGYRWTMEGGKPMLAGGRSMMLDGSILEARRPTSAPAP